MHYQGMSMVCGQPCAHKPQQEYCTEQNCRALTSQSAQGWISLDRTLDFTWHEAHM